MTIKFTIHIWTSTSWAETEATTANHGIALRWAGGSWSLLPWSPSGSCSLVKVLVLLWNGDGSRLTGFRITIMDRHSYFFWGGNLILGVRSYNVWAWDISFHVQLRRSFCERMNGGIGGVSSHAMLITSYRIMSYHIISTHKSEVWIFSLMNNQF
jgi:hypothetical protein